MKRKETISSTYKKTTLLLTARYYTFSKRYVLLDTVKCDSIAEVDYRLLLTETLRDDLKLLEIHKISFVALAIVYIVKDVLNATRKQAKNKVMHK